MDFDVNFHLDNVRILCQIKDPWFLTSFPTTGSRLNFGWFQFHLKSSSNFFRNHQSAEKVSKFSNFRLKYILLNVWKITSQVSSKIQNWREVKSTVNCCDPAIVFVKTNFGNIIIFSKKFILMFQRRFGNKILNWSSLAIIRIFQERIAQITFNDCNPINSFWGNCF